jgi:hypothetical protein
VKHKQITPRDPDEAQPTSEWWVGYVCVLHFLEKPKQITARDLDKAQPKSSWWAVISFVRLLVGGDFVCAPPIPP